MEFYISWSHSDALFANTYQGCPTLVSATPENINPFRGYQTPPQKVIIDSGVLYYQKQVKHVSVLDVLHRQEQMVSELPSSTKIQFVQFDQTLLNKSRLTERVAALEKNLFLAYEYMNVFTRTSRKHNIIPMGVIQGYDAPSITYTIHELRKLGYSHFGIGSLLSRNSHDQISLIQHAIKEIGPNPLHVFGVTGLPQIKKMVQLGVASIDSSRPTMAAAYYQVFYSQPFRTFVLDKSRVTERKNQRIQTPLPCECPVCQVNPYDLLIPSPRHYMKLRSLHNYYHLLLTIQQEKECVSNAIPDVLRT